MPAVATDEMLDVLSVLDSNDEPALGNCTLQMGDIALEFKNGRSKVPLRHAAEVLRHPQVVIPGYQGPAAPAPPNESAELPEIAEDVRQHPQETPEQREARISAAEEYLRSQGLQVPEREKLEVPAAATEREQTLAARIAELEQMLNDAVPLTSRDDDASGQSDNEKDTGNEDKPTADATAMEVQIPDGIEPETADGKPRCWIRKGDGAQCTNPSIEGSHACNLKAHQKKASQ